MILQEDLKKKNILFEPKSRDRWKLINELLDLAEKNKELDSGIKDLVREKLLEREKTASTGIGDDVAIPHCAINEIKNTLVFMAISKKGIEFDSIDGAPAKIIILLIVSVSKMSLHIKNLTSIAKILKDKAFRDNLLELENANAIMQAFKSYQIK
jgi:mannitol/fructose-specific phosphotransferase system IIA component (Ntr-type)